MRRTEELQGIRLMKFEEIYGHRACNVGSNMNNPPCPGASGRAIVGGNSGL